jgi:hypothetical protein
MTDDKRPAGSNDSSRCVKFGKTQRQNKGVLAVRRGQSRSRGPHRHIGRRLPLPRSQPAWSGPWTIATPSFTRGNPADDESTSSDDKPAKTKTKDPKDPRNWYPVSCEESSLARVVLRPIMARGIISRCPKKSPSSADQFLLTGKGVPAESQQPNSAAATRTRANSKTKMAAVFQLFCNPMAPKEVLGPHRLPPLVAEFDPLPFDCRGNCRQSCR